jgi:TRAP-type mannitol/chloroaromatic compound transport system permease large subunit
VIEFVTVNIAPIMFGSLLLFLLSGFPVAFALSAVGMSFGWLTVELGIGPAQFFNALPLRPYGITANDVMLAIPFFTFMGLILERSRMAEDLPTPSARCSGRCAQAWPLRWCWSARCWPPPPAWWRRRSSRWA